ncbi:MAG TPA: signal peptidase I, partial [Labilithrix sp.]
MSEPERRSKSVAAVLSLVVPGLGQIYMGHAPRGAVWMAAAVLGPVVLATMSSAATRGVLLASGAAALLLAAACIVDAVRFCTPRGAIPKTAMIIVGVVFYFVAPVFVALLLRIFVIEAFKIPSGSMMPTLMVGDHIFVDKAVFRHRPAARGETMVFKYPEHPEQDFVKRVIGVGGDRIEVRGGHPVVNGREVPSCYAGKWSYSEQVDWGGMKHEGDLFVELLGDVAYLTFYDASGLSSDFQGPWTVEPGHVFVMGDNRNNAHDSRMWFGGQGGTVPPEY